ncbi:protein FAR1-RELATED SEQUENCE 5-like [Helianthus annuus]|uniref:protein FAR1-RELATED SEQUENCE 5-like n=1 Tax=Helianthus annuus TaxID=4232 RepID=UPI000B8FA1BA|nr:protein FAR1-RELATED SEQUENCE 5-like [Helianthus annuus]
MDMIFTSLDDCYSMYVTYAKACGFSVRKGTEKINDKGEKHIKYYMCMRAGVGSWKVYKFVEEHNHDLFERPDKHFLPTERHITQLQKHVIHNMSTLNLGPVKVFNVMKTCFGGFEDMGASKFEFKNYKRYAMVFVPFTGIDNHHCNVTFGAALLVSETTDTYIWLLRVFLKVVGS